MMSLSPWAECQTPSLDWSKTRRNGATQPFSQLREVFRLPDPDNDSRPAPSDAGHPTPPAGPQPGPTPGPAPVAWLDGSQPVTGPPVTDGPAPGLAWSFGLDLDGLLSAIGATQAGRPEDVQGPRAVGDPDGHELSFAAERDLVESAEADGSRGRDLTGVIADQLPAGPGLAAWLSGADVGELSDYDLPAIAAGYRRIASWAFAGDLAASAEITSRAAARDPKACVDEDGRPSHVTAAAGAELSLTLTQSHYTAMRLAHVACDLRWRLRATGAALTAGTIDKDRARLISEYLSVLNDDDDAVRAEAMVLPRAGQQTTGQLREALQRAVIKVDPRSADERREQAARRARVSLYPDPDGTAGLAASKLPGDLAAAAMARLSAIARAMKASGAAGGIDLLRAQAFIGLLLGTLQQVPPPPRPPPPPHPAPPRRPRPPPAPPPH